MRSAFPKVLHRVGGRSLVGHALSAVKAAKFDAVSVVIGPNHENVGEEAKRFAPDAKTFVQRDRKGTAHAVMQADLTGNYDAIVVAFGDTPFVSAETLARMGDAVKGNVAVAALGFRAADPTGYGRFITRDGKLVAIREHKDASESERNITLCNAGIMALAGKHAAAILKKISNNNANGEFYLTDAVEIAAGMGLDCVALETSEDEVRGINTKAQLAEAEAVLQAKLRQRAMEQGVTLIAPETVFLSEDTKFGSDVVVEPYVVFAAGVVVEDGAVIHSFSHLDGAHVGKQASIGPYARLRPGTKLGAKVRIGNFVETKAANIEDGAKANHLSYIGDARVGENANVGAGTITCNYDGFGKAKTDIGAGAFIGSNSSLVAPVKIGDGAYIGSGSVITLDVPADALAVGRGRQSVKEGWAKRLRDARLALKK
ncbi:bifunctional protein GlmU [Variibacter gotjawalensis]|uniref:Bifunctional protein GlmU n=2 Tax=Variibacter gotjawalensis TaxID=1333996 RepID=A0A0S3PXH1_9BRAD|nr:bifunctional UDP-N-acetylglucosamine diphosphorylase/glucosamine-1-phosphate N-acetyltransferase GlmU [Variibacter gotjawalensis]NIK46477.1 bifunctional UDP-N-acetylglucosamine pyrophosphorylase/glucosamine-1-phosphate N-acetyltransferase [Variibacter gotjawalensis]BAT60645.1 bifunctional protein GlmU [Variibacter gotjawalensis]